MFGSLMMFASGRLGQLAELGERVGDALLLGSRRSGKLAMMRPAREMSRVSTLTPAVDAYARTTGRNEYVASAGASSVWV